MGWQSPCPRCLTGATPGHDLDVGGEGAGGAGGGGGHEAGGGLQWPRRVGPGCRLKERGLTAMCYISIKFQYRQVVARASQAEAQGPGRHLRWRQGKAPTVLLNCECNGTVGALVGDRMGCTATNVNAGPGAGVATYVAHPIHPLLYINPA